MNKLSIFNGFCSLRTGAIIVCLIEITRPFFDHLLRPDVIPVEVTTDSNYSIIQLFSTKLSPCDSKIRNIITYCTFVCSILFLFGIVKKKSGLAAPLAFITPSDVLLNFILGVHSFMSNCSRHTVLDTHQYKNIDSPYSGIVHIICAIIIPVLRACCCHVIMNCYSEMVINEYEKSWTICCSQKTE